MHLTIWVIMPWKVYYCFIAYVNKIDTQKLINLYFPGFPIHHLIEYTSLVSVFICV